MSTKIFCEHIVKKIFNSIGIKILYLHNTPEYTLLGLRNLPICSIIDVGANEGQFARMISKFFPDAHIYCFEPLPHAFNKLSEFAKKQDGKIEVYNIAIGDSEGTMEMFSHVEHSPSSSLLKSTEVCEELYPFTQKQIPISINLTTLDKVVADFFTPLIPEILIKLDVQGYENRVIKGGDQTFRKARACILEVGLDSLYENQATFKEILSFLDNLGYRYAGNLEQVYANDGYVIYIDSVFINRKL